MGNSMNQQPKNNSKMLLYIAVAVILILLYLYITKPTQTTVIQTNSTTQNNSAYQSILQANISQLRSATSQLETTNQNLNSQIQQIRVNERTPIIKQLYQNYTITVPAYQSNYVFYNSTYNLYNNYTISGLYNISFYAPYDGYLILYVQHTNAPIDTYGISSNSNSSDFIECYGGCPYFNLTGGGVEKGLSGFSDTPADNATFYHFLPVLRGQQNFSFQNDNNYPIQVTFSLTYVGDNNTNLVPLTINYS